MRTLVKASEVRGETLVLRLEGELAGEASQEFKSWAATQLREGPSQVEVDCEKLSYIDSSGLGSLIYLRKCAIDREGELRLTQISDWLSKFLQVTGLLTTFCGEDVRESG